MGSAVVRAGAAGVKPAERVVGTAPDRSMQIVQSNGTGKSNGSAARWGFYR